ncbi:MAG TPA: hypothetical protein VFQ77_11050 [Pseudonocardiaceae bacterium]|jgi:hypothetical protein|nr:hypothetical protein [Pseudonocardiaceae bacterium]
MSLLVRLAWQTSLRLTVLAAGVELVSGCVTAFGLLATANVFHQLLEQGPTPQRVVAALPALALVTASFAARGLLDAAAGAVLAVLAPGGATRPGRAAARLAGSDRWLAECGLSLCRKARHTGQESPTHWGVKGWGGGVGARPG